MVGLKERDINMKIAIIYFTGTHNTRYLANRIKALFENAEELKTIEVGKGVEIVDLNDFDLLFVGYPIYGFNSQPVLTNYLRKVKKLLKPGKKLDYIIFKNSGETYAMNNSSSRVIKRILSKKHFNFLSEYHFGMPYNIHFPFANNLIKQLLNYTDKQLEILKYNYDNNIPHVIKSKLIYDVAGRFVSVQKLGGFVNSFFYRVDEDKCTHCNACVNICPLKNISVKKDGKIKFHHNCAMCMRCSFFCPKGAINIGMLQGWKVLNYYNLKQIEKDDTIKPDFITDETTGFYKCYIKTFKDIDKEYEEIQTKK